MSTHSRPKNKRQLRHPGSRSRSHQLDKQEGEARQKNDWLRISAPESPTTKRTFGTLQGHEYTFDGEQWQRCEGPEEFADYIEAEAAKRSWFMDHPKRKGVATEMRRRVASPVEVLTTTFAPWLSDWLAAETVQGRDARPKLAAIRNRWREAAAGMLAGSRYLMGYAFHADTDDPHFDLVLSRQDGKGGRIGKPGLLLVGPWCTAVDRQLRSGATIRPDKSQQIKRSIANFRHRYGEDQKPLDVMLARALDAAAEAVLGVELTPYKEAYAQRVPELERQHVEAQLEVIEAAKEKLLERIAPTPPPGPDPEITLDR